MANHDNYDKDILKALQKIANSLDRIEKRMSDKPMTMNETREKFGLPGIENDDSILANGFCSKCKKMSTCSYKVDARTIDDDLKIGYAIPIYIPGINAPIGCQLEFSKKEE